MFHEFEGARDISTIKRSFADKNYELMKFVNGRRGEITSLHVPLILTDAHLGRDDKPDRFMLQKPKHRER